MDRIYVYTKPFSEFSTSAHDAIRRLPANANDQFTLIVAQGDTGKVGFDASEALSNLFFCLTEKMERLGVKNGKPINFDFFSGGIYVKKETEELDSELKKYERNKIKIKKNEMLEKRTGRTCPPPAATVLESLLDGSELNQDAYFFLLNNCSYCAFVYPSTEYGRFTTYVFSKEIDVFFNDLESCLGDLDLIKVSDVAKIPCW
ncbi:hypothetical protein [Halomonas sp. A29]|uniref:hypothetical protein n=1 Tax=Halomonas sp. A29 TaxID=3102786 RepID=UPI00398A7E3C